MENTKNYICPNVFATRQYCKKVRCSDIEGNIKELTNNETKEINKSEPIFCINNECAFCLEESIKKVSVKRYQRSFKLAYYSKDLI